jgi:hypothetical protein
LGAAMKLAYINYIFFTIIALTIIGCSDAVNRPMPTDIIQLSSTKDGSISMTGQRAAANEIAFTIQQLDETAATTLAPIPAGRIFVTGFNTNNNNSAVLSDIIVNMKLSTVYNHEENLQVYRLEALNWKLYKNLADILPGGKDVSLTIDSLQPIIVVSNNFKVALNKDFNLSTGSEVNIGIGDFTWTTGRNITPSLSMIKKSTVDFNLLTIATIGGYSSTAGAISNNDTWLIRTVKSGVGYVYYKVKFLSIGENGAVFQFAKLQEVIGPKVLIQPIFAASGNTTIASAKTMSWSDDPRAIAYTGIDGVIYKVSPVAGSIPVPAIKSNDIATLNGAVCPNFIPAQGNTICFMTGAYITDTYTNSTDFHLMKVSPLNPIPDAFILRQLDPTLVGLPAALLRLPLQMSVSANADRMVGFWTTGIYAVDFGGNSTNSIKIATAAETKNISISPNGINIALSKVDGKIYLRSFYGAETLVGDGNWPSFNADGSKLGYMNDGVYVIKNLLTGTTQSYELPYGTVWSAPALAPSTNHIIFRTSNGGMSLGILLD